MTTRKCISRLLAGVLGVSLLLTGCAGTGGTKSGKADNKKAVSVKLDPDDPVDITFWHYYNGEQQQEMKKLCLTIADVLEGLRTSGILDPAEVETAIVEANGAINAFPYASKRPPIADEMNVDPGYEGLPMTLIMDGRIQTGNLGTAQLDQTQLEQMLSSRRLAAESVFFCSLDTQGRMMIQDRAGNVTQFQAIDPGEVKW